MELSHPGQRQRQSGTFASLLVRLTLCLGRDRSRGIEGNELMMNPASNDPLHGITLEMMLTQLVQKYGWVELAKRIPIRCFYNEPSLKSSLKFLRRTPWVRKDVEELYLRMITR